MKKLQQDGFHATMAIITLLVVGLIGFAGWRVVKGKQGNTQTTSVNQPATSQTSAKPKTDVKWQWDGSKWTASDTPPNCTDPLAFTMSPTDVSKAASILYPGQQRSTGYKPHGGFKFSNIKNSDVTVKVPIDARLMHGSRYIEAGETQYLLYFENSCGLAFRFDHLLTLDAKLQAIVDTLPAAKQDDSRTTNFDNPQSFKAGDVVATAVGFSKTSNVSFDFGVYDLRKRNSAASDPAFVNKHQSVLSQAAYGVCWFDMLPSKDAAIVKGLPATDQAAGKTSDYCK